MPEGLPARVSRLSVRAVHRLLVSALIAFWLLVGVLIYFRVSPLLPEDPFPPAIAPAFCACFLLAALFWSRPRIAPRQSMVTIEDYWRDAKIKAAMDLFLFLLEGSARDRRTGSSLEP